MYILLFENQLFKLIYLKLFSVDIFQYSVCLQM